MLYISPKFLSSDIKCRHPDRQTTSTALCACMWEWSPERADFILSLPLRYTGLPVRRRLIRMMLTLQKYGEIRCSSVYQKQDRFTPSADYARSVIDTAMLRGELRCRPSGEMAHAYLAQTEELLSLMAGAPPDKAQLRKEVRRRISDFLRIYAMDAEA